MPQLLIQIIQCKSVRFSRHKQLIFQQATADKIAVSDFMAKRTVALVQKILCLESFQTFPFQPSEKFRFQISFETFRVSGCQSFLALFFWYGRTKEETRCFLPRGKAQGADYCYRLCSGYVIVLMCRTVY